MFCPIWRLSEIGFEADFVYKHLIILAGLMEKFPTLELINYFSFQGVLMNCMIFRRETIFTDNFVRLEVSSLVDLISLHGALVLISELCGALSLLRTMHNISGCIKL